MGNLLIRYWSGKLQEAPKVKQVIAVALFYLPELEGKVLLLKIQHT